MQLPVTIIYDGRIICQLNFHYRMIVRIKRTARHITVTVILNESYDNLFCRRVKFDKIDGVLHCIYYK